MTSNFKRKERDYSKMADVFEKNGMMASHREAMAEGYNAWLPISAAPRDGSIVVVFAPGGEPNTAFYCDGEWKCSTRAGDIYHDPDRFMFIPSPFPLQSGSEDTQ